jgi:hypothetical protein
MIIKAGILVFCQFFITTDRIDSKDAANVQAPREMVGTVINVKKEKTVRTEKRNGNVYALEDEKTILEVEGTEPQPMHFFINADACTAVQPSNALKEQEEELARKNEEIKNKDKAPAEQAQKEELNKLKKKQSHKRLPRAVATPTPAVEYMRDSSGKAIQVDTSDMADFKYKEPTPEPSATQTPAVVESKPEELAPEANAPVVDNLPPLVVEQKPIVPEKKEEKVTPSKKAEKSESNVKNMMNDIFNVFKK